MVNEGNVSWDNENITDGRNPGLKLKKDQTARIAILSKDAYMVLDHYSTKARRHARCIKSKGMCPACSVLGDPKERFACKVLIYRTAETGEVLAPFSGKVAVWVFGADKFVQLRAIRKQWGDLRGRDLTVTCTDENFQRFTIQPCPDCLFRKDKKTLDAVKALSNGFKMTPEEAIGKILTADEMSKLLELGHSSTGPEDGMHVIEGGMDDAMEEAAPDLPTETPAASETPAEVDLDKFLDEF